MVGARGDMPQKGMGEISLPMAEDRAADADNGGAFLDGGLKVIGHAHGEFRQSMASFLLKTVS